MVKLANNEAMKDYQKPKMEVLELRTQGSVLECTSEQYSNGKCMPWGIEP
jgi:hypothetical protein